MVPNQALYKNHDGDTMFAALHVLDRGDNTFSLFEIAHQRC